MPTEYFEQRERALLGQRYEQLYAAPQQFEVLWQQFDPDQK